MSLSTTAKYFRLLCCVIILVFAALCIRNVDMKSVNDTGRYKKQAGSQMYNSQRSKRSSNELNITLCPGTKTSHTTTCNKGQRFNATTGECFPCVDETYIPEDNHRCQECIECQIDDYDNKVIETRQGNSTHQPEFCCEADYCIERYKEHKKHCKIPECSKRPICDSSESTLCPCTNTGNAVCCDKCTKIATTPAPMPDNTTSPTDKIKCQRNYYVDNINNTCQLCPSNTYIDEDNHTMYFCLNCSEVQTGQAQPSGCSATGSGNSGMSIAHWIGLGIGVGIFLLFLIVVIVIVCMRTNPRFRQVVMSCLRRQERTERNGSIREALENELFIRNSNGS
ncbi:hypothetical protein BsWGS_26655 [Bradybaena similaris]